MSDRAREQRETWSPLAQLDTLISGLEIETLRAPRAAWPVISAVTLDLEEVTEGTLFIARRLWYTNTHAQVREAARRGAVAILVSERHAEVEALLESEDERLTQVPVLFTAQEDPTLGLICDRYYGHPTTALKVYGVTGTNGKTSAISYLAELLRSAGERVAVIGTVAYRCEDRILPAPNTTPDALVIHRLARQALTLGATSLALEVSSHALSLSRVAGVAFDAVGFTSWGRDHLDFHGTLEAYREAKGMLFDVYLRESISRGKAPIAVAHDDEPGRDMLRRTPLETRRVLCRVSLTERADQRESHETSSSNTVSAQVRVDETLSLQLVGAPSAQGVVLSGAHYSSRGEENLTAQDLPLIGDYHPSNLAIALGMIFGTHPDHLQRSWRSLTQTRGVPGRMERVTLSQEVERDAEGRVALVDYAHTPDAITRALQALRAVHRGAVHVVIGCGGDRDRGKRPKMTSAALKHADVVWLTSDNPRSEDPQQIISDALTLDASERDLTTHVRCEIDRRTCLARAWSHLPPNGALLITGKGHEEYQEIGERRYRLHDVEALRASAWAQHHHTALRDVPYIASAVSERALELSVEQRFIDLCREGIGRPDGLGLCVLTRARASECSDQLRDAHQAALLWVGHEPTQDANLTSYEHLIQETCARLTPSIKWIVWVVERVEELSDLKEYALRLNALVEEPHPHLSLRVCFESDEALSALKALPHQGGWPKLQRGPKIPTFL